MLILSACESNVCQSLGQCNSQVGSVMQAELQNLNCPHHKGFQSGNISSFPLGIQTLPFFILILFKNMFCAGARGKDSCQGDSGGRSLHFTPKLENLIQALSSCNECPGSSFRLELCRGASAALTSHRGFTPTLATSCHGWRESWHTIELIFDKAYKEK